MKRSRRTCRLAALALLGFFAGSALQAQSAPRERILIDADWRFAKDDPPLSPGRLAYPQTKAWFAATGNEFLNAAAAKPARPPGNLGGDVPYVQAAFDDRAWRALDLPHDWGIAGPFHREYDSATARLPWWGVGWYRKHLAIPAGDKDRRVYLDIDGAMAYAMVWLNGQFVGGWPYGYASFELDLTPYLKAGGDNVLAIRLDNPPLSSRWYPGGGIYRNVWLVKTSPVHVSHWGTYVTTPQISDDAAIVDVQAMLKNPLGARVDAQVSTRLYELGFDGLKSGEPVAASAPAAVPIAAGRQALSEQILTVPHPKLWSLERPRRYVAVTTVAVAGAVADVYETPFGIRTIAFTADGGFSLNGRRVPINGVCDHADFGALGTALNLPALERQLQMLREMGCNAIRTSHNPPAPELLDLCDRLGMLVMDESFDCWMTGKRPNDYHLLFADWHEKDLRALVRRDRNHPSVILWSIGNEIPEQKQPEGWRLAQHLAGIVREEDRTRPITAAYNDVESGYNGFETAVDVLGYNYKPGEYGKFRQSRPLQPLFGSETASTISSRGEYAFPVVDDQAQGQTADHQMSSYDLYAPRWATPPDAEFKGHEENPFVAGEFVWTGWDYLGEPTPYGHPDDTARSSYFGIIDLAGFKKDRFYLYQAHWRPDLPMAHLLPHWTWPERVGQVTPVHVYTSGDEAELFLNGRSLGRKKKGPLEYRLRWDDVVYQPGELRVVAYKDGKKWAEDVERTAGPAAKLSLQADRRVLAADGRDLAFVTVTIADRRGVPAPRAKNHVKFSLTGPGEIAAVDDGDPTSFEPFQASEHDAFNGLVLGVVRTKPGQAGAITVRAQSDGLAAGEIELLSAAAPDPSYATAFVPPASPPAFWSWAPRPPMGWNSWDCFATTITEAQAKAEADVMAAQLRAHGWEYLTVDIQWYEPGAADFDYRQGAPLIMDEWGRLLPAPNRFPSAAGGAGFKSLADYVHGRGLKFGLHLLRGIPRQAVAQNTPIQGTPYHAADIADSASVCSWNTDMDGVDMAKPGAQAYYDSVFALLAQWGVDFVKVDDISRPYHDAEIAAIRSAIDRTGRPIVLSLSPGATPLAQGSRVAADANLWRISDDFWDQWPALLAQFTRLDRWSAFAGPGHFPDADMLPLGTIDLGRRRTHFTPDEQRTLLTLWSIARSPLILGADLTKLDEATLALITNDAVLAVDQASSGNRQLFRRGDLAAWVADVPGSPDKYLAVFNLADGAGAAAGQAVPVKLADLGLAGAGQVRDLWEGTDLGQFTAEFSPKIPRHGAGLYRVSPR